MELVKPAIGLIFWMSVTFLTLLFILAKFAWKPILSMIKEREKNIEESLQQAEKARAEMASLTSKNEELLNMAKEERNKILADAKVAAEKLRSDIVEKAKAEADRKVADALREIEVQKKAALAEVKNQVGLMALEIAEKVVRKELKTDSAQKEFAEKLAKEANLN